MRQHVHDVARLPSSPSSRSPPAVPRHARSRPPRRAATTTPTPGADLAGAQPAQPSADGDRRQPPRHRRRRQARTTSRRSTSTRRRRRRRHRDRAPSQLLDQAKAALDGGHPHRGHRALPPPRRRLSRLSAGAGRAVQRRRRSIENLGDIPAADRRLPRAWSRSFPRGRESLDAHLRAAGLEAERKRLDAAPSARLREIALRDRPRSSRSASRSRPASATCCSSRRRRRRRPHRARGARSRRGARPSASSDRYFIAMAHYYLGELAHRDFGELLLRSPDDHAQGRPRRQGEARRRRPTIAGRQALEFEGSVLGARRRLPHVADVHGAAGRPRCGRRIPTASIRRRAAFYEVEVHDRVRRHLHTALEGHQMNVKLAAAYGVEQRLERRAIRRSRAGRDHRHPAARDAAKGAQPSVALPGDLVRRVSSHLMWRAAPRIARRSPREKPRGTPLTCEKSSPIHSQPSRRGAPVIAFSQEIPLA